VNGTGTLPPAQLVRRASPAFVLLDEVVLKLLAAVGEKVKLY